MRDRRPLDQATNQEETEVERSEEGSERKQSALRGAADALLRRMHGSKPSEQEHSAERVDDGKEVQPGTSRGRAMRYAATHPMKAIRIGQFDDKKQHTDLTNDAVRFSRRLGLDDGHNYVGLQINAVRHTLWQAAIAAQIDAKTAKEVGDVHEDHKDILRNVADVTKIIFDESGEFEADEYVDQSNNAIGRTIGSAHPGASMAKLAGLVIEQYHAPGLYEQTQESDGSIHIVLTRLSDDHYEKAKRALAGLDRDGLRPDEPRSRTPLNRLTEQKKK